MCIKLLYIMLYIAKFTDRWIDGQLGRIYCTQREREVCISYHISYFIYHISSIIFCTYIYDIYIYITIYPQFPEIRIQVQEQGFQ